MKYIGIADCYGLESFISIDDKVVEWEFKGMNGNSELNKLINALHLRANANRHRHAVLYRADVGDANEIEFLMNHSKQMAALKRLKVIATNIEVMKDIGAKKSWGLIPDPRLDPTTD